MEYFVQQLINGVTLGSIYGLIAIGYTMVYGIIGMINFAHGDIFMIGAFVALIALLLLQLGGGALDGTAAILLMLIASVAVTQGLLEKLDRDELQGVIAHEMAHVGNFDIRYAMLVGILVGTTVLISDFFLRGLWFGGGRGGGRREGGGQLQIIMIVVAIFLAILAPLFARLLQLSISRQREYLADATAVRLSRNPKGLADALQKISGDREVLEVANRATAHLYIANPIKRFEKRSKGIFSTHPPIEDRIRILRAMESGGVVETAG